MQQKAQTPTSGHTQRQVEALNEAQTQPQSLIPIQTQGHKPKYGDTEMPDSNQAPVHHQVQADTQMADTAQAEATEPAQLQDCMEVYTISPAESQTPARKEAQDEVCNQSYEPEQAQPLPQVQARVQLAASPCEEASTGASNPDPMENVVYEHVQDEGLGQTQQGSLRAQSPAAVPAAELASVTAQSAAPVQVQEHGPLHAQQLFSFQAQEQIQQHAQKLFPFQPQEESQQHAQKLSPVRAPSTQPKPAKASEVSLFQGVIQAGLQHSLQGVLQASLDAYDVVALTLRGQIQDKLSIGVQGQGQMLSIEVAQPQQVPQAEEQLASEQQNNADRMLEDGRVQETVPSGEEDQTQAEQGESQEAQLRAGRLENTEKPVCSKDGEAADDGSRRLTKFSQAQRAMDGNVDITCPSNPGIQEEKTAGAHPQIDKCHHCTKSKLRCNGERPCQFCIKYRKRCYNLNERPARNMRGHNLRAGGRSTTKASERQLAAAAAAAPEKADDRKQPRQPKPVHQVSSTQQGLADQSVATTTTHNEDATEPEPDTHLTDHDDHGFERLGSSAAASERTRAAQSQSEEDQTCDDDHKEHQRQQQQQQQQQQTTQSQPTKPANARKPKQEKETARNKARNVTTRLAEQKEAGEDRRSLRAMAHRGQT
ncbi:hypothetical protein A1O7_00361 [Cladophialophora yegresii CBS 114405]|uniref:Zn(2)-C6 fungal-type domain-containing protein n=1 Tax=Cladophialophora yegresii CBS 114405 TaxID=1182544 RepID=W9WHD8_9EURO|nr:uncharacterized protein A1O7_00361 [Cladophialophora yegresii CBS 114405]EXJ64026.1 hypothetical protein A1O7_00361 [Cladophialophora yegresii CBS 114405]